MTVNFWNAVASAASAANFGQNIERYGLNFEAVCWLAFAILWIAAGCERSPRA